MESRWSSSGQYFPEFTTLGIPEEIHKIMAELQCEPEQRIIFMSVLRDIVSGERGNTENWENNFIMVAICARRFLHGRWSFWGPGSEKKWDWTYSDKPDGDWDKTAER